MKKPKNKTWVIRKIVTALTLEEAMKKEKRAKITSIVEFIKPDEQLTPAIGFDSEIVTPDYDD